MKKTINIIFAVLLILSMAACGGSSEPASSSTGAEQSTTPPPVQKQWVEVFSFKGNGMKKSASFHLSGGNARVKYDYKSEMEGMGAFNLYVVPHGHDIMKEGGIPEAMVSQSEASETYIQKPAGDYYIDITAAGNWSVSVEEEK